MLQTYKIDQAKINAIKKRVLIRYAKILLIAFLPALLVLYRPNGATPLKHFDPSLFFSVPLILLAGYYGVNKSMRSYRTLEITLNDTGVEMKAEMWPYKQIAWQNLKMEEKSNGGVNLYDTTIAAFTRKMYGRGWIQVQPEMLNLDSLIKELRTRGTRY